MRVGGRLTLGEGKGGFGQVVYIYFSCKPMGSILPDIFVRGRFIIPDVFIRVHRPLELLPQCRDTRNTKHFWVPCMRPYTPRSFTDDRGGETPITDE